MNLNFFKKLRSTAVKSKHYCICCNKSIDTFLPFGVVQRENALCPLCGSLERHRLDWHFITKHTQLLNGTTVKKVLHVAPDAVFFHKFKGSHLIDYVPCAKLEEGYEDVYPDETINVDITDIDFSDHTFDVIYCSHVLEHIPDDLSAMRELYRVLKPGGWAMLQVPIDEQRDETFEDPAVVDPKEREKIFGQRDHVRIYGNDYQDRLSAAGFTVVRNNYVKQFSEAEKFRFGFLENEAIYYCTKNLFV